MDLEETEARNDCAGEVQQQFNRPTDSGVSGELTAEVGGWQLELIPPREIAAKGSTSYKQRLEYGLAEDGRHPART
jgi:hypothetical protein